MRKILLLTLFGASFWMLSSCSQQYDWATMDKHITVGGDNFVFPLGHSHKMVVDSILDFGSIKELKKDADGNYFFNYEGLCDTSITISAFANSDIDVNADTIWKTIPITGIPDYMRDAVLDLSHPMILMTVTSNATVPIKVGSRFVSIDSKSWRLASTLVNLDIDSKAPSPSDSTTTNFVIANEKLTGEGFVYVKGDIDTLVHTLPTYLMVGLVPTQKIMSVSKSSQQTIGADASAWIKMNFNLTLPLQFGPDLKMSFRDTITGMPDILRDVMEKNDVSFIGTASSTFPVNLSFKMNMLDENGKDLGITSTEGDIPGTDDPLTPKESEYELEMKASSNAKKISKMEVIFYMTEGNGTCLNKNHWVQLDIQASVPGGIELEIKD